jgi:hypothetical protein
MRDKQGIAEGDRFMKVDSVQPVVWVVDKLLETPGLPRHVRLVKESSRDSTTVSMETLTNGRFFRPATD